MVKYIEKNSSKVFCLKRKISKATILLVDSKNQGIVRTKSQLEKDFIKYKKPKLNKIQKKIKLSLHEDILRMEKAHNNLVKKQNTIMKNNLKVLINKIKPKTIFCLINKIGISLSSDELNLIKKSGFELVTDNEDSSKYIIKYYSEK